ncbi:hypothetical protein GCM10027517_23370 [Phycicoccus ginsengisoli]
MAGISVPGGSPASRPTDQDIGFRQYTETDVEKILVIRRVKPLGFTLDQMSAAVRRRLR